MTFKIVKDLNTRNHTLANFVTEKTGYNVHSTTRDHIHTNRVLSASKQKLVQKHVTHCCKTHYKWKQRSKISNMFDILSLDGIIKVKKKKKSVLITICQLQLLEIYRLWLMATSVNSEPKSGQMLCSVFQSSRHKNTLALKTTTQFWRHGKSVGSGSESSINHRWRGERKETDVQHREGEEKEKAILHLL